MDNSNLTGGVLSMSTKSAGRPFTAQRTSALPLPYSFFEKSTFGTCFAASGASKYSAGLTLAQPQ